jgi:hypothetical protein
MTFKIEEIENACYKIGLSQSIVKTLIDNLPHKRSSQENKALHVLFQNISFALNQNNFEYTWRGIQGFNISTKYTPEIVKNFIWKPLQDALLNKQSTTQLTHNDIQLIFEILGKFFAENKIEIQFPSKEQLMLKE